VWVQCMASRLQPSLGKGQQGGREREGAPRYLEVGNPEVGGLAVLWSGGDGEVFLRVQTRGVQDLLRQKLAIH
jgi:hypothetical protein